MRSRARRRGASWRLREGPQRRPQPLKRSTVMVKNTAWVPGHGPESNARFTPTVASPQRRPVASHASRCPHRQSPPAADLGWHKSHSRGAAVPKPEGDLQRAASRSGKPADRPDGERPGGETWHPSPHGESGGQLWVVRLQVRERKAAGMFYSWPASDHKQSRDPRGALTGQPHPAGPRNPGKWEQSAVRRPRGRAGLLRSSR